MKKTLQSSIVSIYNGQLHNFSEISVIRSKQIIKFLKCLYNEGFIRGFCVEDSQIKVFLKYFNGNPVINVIEGVSTISNRIYISRRGLLKVVNKKETFIIMTVKGFTSSKKVFEKGFTGGEIICRIH